MAAPDRASSRRLTLEDRRDALSHAVDLIRDGETVLSLIDPAARGRDPEAFTSWLQARLTIAQLPRVMLPGCDARCDGIEHAADLFVTIGDLALDPTEPRPGTWWAAWNETLDRSHQSGTIWYAGAPAMPVTAPARRLPAGTRLRRVADHRPVLGRLRRRAAGVAAADRGRTVGRRLARGRHASATPPLLPALAGTLVAPDHPPARDPQVAVRLLAAGWAAVERGLPYED